MPRDGFLNLLKPPGPTSHDVVAWVRGHLGQHRIGHLGTLDPAAAGVLPIALGRATRLFQWAAGDGKTYRAEVVFGRTTDTLDAEGRVLSETDASALTAPALADLIPRFLGEQEQAPPAFSAAKVGGRSLHRQARAGEPVEGTPKRITISSMELLDFEPGPEPRALLDIECSAGTYVRVLARDLGRAAGCGAYLGFLVRTRAGRFMLEDSTTFEEIAEALDRGAVEDCILPIDWPLNALTEVDIDPRAAVAFLRGTRVAAGNQPASPVRVYGPAKSFLGLGEVPQAGVLQPKVVLASEEEIPQ